MRRGVARHESGSAASRNLSARNSGQAHGLGIIWGTPHISPPMPRYLFRSATALAAVLCACHHAPPVVATSQPATQPPPSRPAPRANNDDAERARRDSIARADSLRRAGDAAARA